MSFSQFFFIPKSRGKDEYFRQWYNSLKISSIWKPSDLIVTVVVPKSSSCAEVSEKDRSVLDKYDHKTRNSSLEQTFSLDEVGTGFSLNCANIIPFFGSLFGIQEAEVTIKTKSGRLINSFTAKGGYPYGYVSILPIEYIINGDHN